MKQLFPQKGTRVKTKKSIPTWAALLLWGVALASVFFMGVAIVQRTPYIRDVPWDGDSADGGSLTSSLVEEAENNQNLPDSLAELDPDNEESISRELEMKTNQITARMTPETYTIETGDSIYGIANEYDLDPETVLWANYDVLYDDAHNISLGDELVIPPDDGIYYKWKEGDNLQRLADKYRVELKDVLLSPYNNLDATDPVITEGSYILFPGGYRETAAISPVVTEFSANSGANKVISGPGGCEWDYVSYGGGAFVWPNPTHTISGNDYWSGHLGIDIGAVEGSPVYAADGGTVIYAGSISGGYGIMVMIDHGTGYQTLYAHLSSVAVSCGQGVSAGQVIAYSGNTGNSTGAHLHYEVRYGGGYVNPWTMY